MAGTNNYDSARGRILDFSSGNGPFAQQLPVPASHLYDRVGLRERSPAVLNNQRDPVSQ